MVLLQWLNFYSYRQYESHSFIRKCRSMELLWKMQLPFDWTFQVNVFTYSILNATLRVSLQSRTSLGGEATCCYSFLYVPELVYLLQSFMQATRWHKCSHGNMILVYVILPEFCPKFPQLLCIISGILDYLRNCSCLQLDKPTASSSSVYISYHCCNSILFYFSFRFRKRREV